MLALIKKIESNKDCQPGDEQWAKTIETDHGQELQEHPVIFLTIEEEDEARAYLSWFKESDIRIADDATRVVRGTHVAEIIEFLKVTHNAHAAGAEHSSTGDERIPLPSNYRTPTCFDEWYIVTSTWRLTLAMADISYHDAAFGTDDCRISPLPEEWVEKLNDCLKITNASAVIPAPRGPNLPLKRRHLDSILPASDDGTDLSGLFDGIVIDVWCYILLQNRNRRKPGCTVMIPPHSLDLITATPTDIAKNIASVDKRVDMILFPTIIKERDHCILVVAYPQKQLIAVYDSLGTKSTKALRKTHPWLLVDPGDPEKDLWQVSWMESQLQGGEHACAVFMFINAMCVVLGRKPAEIYTSRDTLFLRRFIAAVICKGELPEKVAQLADNGGELSEKVAEKVAELADNGGESSGEVEGLPGNVGELPEEMES